MSIGLMSRASKAPMEINGAKRWALIWLANFADDEGYSYPKVSTICRLSAIKREETVREALRELEADGYIERLINGWAGVKGQIPEGRRPNLYRVYITTDGHPYGPKVTRSAGVGATQNPGTGATQDSGSPAYPESGEENSHLDSSLEVTPPTPSEEGDEDPSLFEQGAGGGDVVSMAERRKRSGRASDEVLMAGFQPWWDRYRSMGDKGRNVGAKSKAFANWKRRLTEGVPPKVLFEALENYMAARALAEEIWEGRPPLMNASTFIGRGGKFTDWDHPIEGPDDERLGPWKFICERDALAQGQAMLAQLRSEM